MTNTTPYIKERIDHCLKYSIKGLVDIIQSNNNLSDVEKRDMMAHLHYVELTFINATDLIMDLNKMIDDETEKTRKVQENLFRINTILGMLNDNEETE
jgi:hypothetical protein